MVQKKRNKTVAMDSNLLRSIYRKFDSLQNELDSLKEENFSLKSQAIEPGLNDDRDLILQKTLNRLLGNSLKKKDIEIAQLKNKKPKSEQAPASKVTSKQKDSVYKRTKIVYEKDRSLLLKLAGKLVHFQTSIKKLQDQITEKDQEIKLLNKKILDLEDNAVKHQGDNSLKEISHLNKENQKQHEELIHYKALLLKMQVLSKKKSIKLNQLLDSSKKNRELYDQGIEKQQKLQERLDEQRDITSSLQEENRLLKDRLISESEKLKHYQSLVAEEHTLIRSLKAGIDNSEKELAKVTDNYLDAEQKKEAALNENLDIKKILESLRQDLLVSQKLSSELLSERAELRQKLNTTLSEYRKLDQKLHQIEEEESVNSRDEEEDKIKHIIESHTEREVLLGSEIERLKNQVNDLKEQLDNSKLELDHERRQMNNEIKKKIMDLAHMFH